MSNTTEALTTADFPVTSEFSSPSESAHLIWVCAARELPRKYHNQQENHYKWLRAINMRLTEDKTASIIKLHIKRVYHSCGKHLGACNIQQGVLPNSCISVREVLVGSRSCRP